jgi:hypothetical protein
MPLSLKIGPTKSERVSFYSCLLLGRLIKSKQNERQGYCPFVSKVKTVVCI